MHPFKTRALIKLLGLLVAREPFPYYASSVEGEGRVESERRGVGTGRKSESERQVEREVQRDRNIQRVGERAKRLAKKEKDGTEREKQEE